MKTLYLGLVISSMGIFALTYLLLVPSYTVLSWDDVSKMANSTASKYGIFSHETDWHVHIAADGKIHPSANHEIDENLIFSCSFSVIPNDARDHFAYLSVFRNNDTGYVVALDDSTGQVIDAKLIPYGSAVCGP